MLCHWSPELWFIFGQFCQIRVHNTLLQALCAEVHSNHCTHGESQKNNDISILPTRWVIIADNIQTPDMPDQDCSNQEVHNVKRPAEKWRMRVKGGGTSNHDSNFLGYRKQSEIYNYFIITTNSLTWIEQKYKAIKVNTDLFFYRKPI